VHHSKIWPPSAAQGQKPRSALMRACRLPPAADMQSTEEWRHVPKGDLSGCSKMAPLFTVILHLVQPSTLLGRRTVNTEPLPGSLATVMSPPII
jgi:hypothetical protein